MKQILKALIVVASFCASNFSAQASERDLVQTSVPIVLDGRLHVLTAAGSGDIPIQISRDWTQAQEDVTRAVIVIHGWPRRNLSAAEYLAMCSQGIQAERNPHSVMQWWVVVKAMC